MLKNAISLFIGCAVILVLFLPAYTQLQDLREKNRQYERKIAELTKKNKQLRLERKRLEEDPVYREKVAREKMGLIRENEVIYKIVPPEPEEMKKSLLP